MTEKLTDEALVRYADHFGGDIQAMARELLARRRADQQTESVDTEGGALKDLISLLSERRMKDKGAIEKLEAKLHQWQNKNEPAWAVGDRVRWVRSQEWGPTRGSTGSVIRIDPDHEGRPFRDYQVFWCRPDGPDIKAQFWTTPDDVDRIA